MLQPFLGRVLTAALQGAVNDPAPSATTRATA